MKKNNNKILTTKDIVLISMMAIILFVQEQILMIIPNFQLTIFLLVLFSKKFGFIKTTIIIFIHVLLDNLIMGSMNIYFIPFMFIGWFIIPLTLNTIFKKVESQISLAILGIVFSCIYCWIFIIPNCLLLEVDFLTYLYADLIWEILLASSSFITILLLYNPCSRVIGRVVNEK